MGGGGVTVGVVGEGGNGRSSGGRGNGRSSGGSSGGRG